MPNNKPIGVAYADPALDSATVSGAVTAATVTASGTVTADTVVTANSTGKVAGLATIGFYAFTTAITANTTVTAATAGSLAITSNATGVGKLFVSDGSKWQFAAIS